MARPPRRSPPSPSRQPSTTTTTAASTPSPSLSSASIRYPSPSPALSNASIPSSPLSSPPRSPPGGSSARLPPGLAGPNGSGGSARGRGGGAGGGALLAGAGGPGRKASTSSSNSPARGSSVQSRRSAASLGLGVQYANMNELTNSSSASSLFSPSPKLASATSPSSTANPSPTGTNTSSPSRDTSPASTTIPLAPAPPISTHSRRSSIQFADRLPPLPPVQTPSLQAAQLPGTSTPGIGHTTASARRPSLTHLASFLSGIEHHTRVRSPGGRGVSRSASRSQSRAGGTRGKNARYWFGSGTIGSDGASDTGGEGTGEESEDDNRRSPRGGFSSEDEYLPEEDEGVEEMRPRPSMYQGTRRGVSDDDDEQEGDRRSVRTDRDDDDDDEGFMFGPPSSQGTSRAGHGSRSNLRRLGSTTSSRASSIRSRSRRSSVSRAGGAGGGQGEGSPHPLLHELVRENTTGGVAPSPTIASAHAPGPGVPSTPFQPDAPTWEETFETYKPSVITTPTTPRSAAARQAPGTAYDDEEPFLDTSAPNSPAMASTSRSPGAGSVHRTRAYSHSTMTSQSSIVSAPTQDLSTVEVFTEGERIGVDVWLEGRGGWVRDCFAGRVERDGKAPGNGLDGPRQLEVERRLGEGTYAIVYLVREVLYDPDPTDDDILSPIDPFASFEFDAHTGSSSGTRPRLHSWASEVYAQPEPTYGRYYALKCLCKKDLTDELIEVQRGEAVLHRALPQHENIVQLYGAYETDDWLFLVLEYVPGNDLFFWLLESQNSGTDHLYSRATSPSDEPFGNGQRRRSFDFKVNRIEADEDDDDSDEADEGALSKTVTADTPAHLLMDQTPPSPSLLSSAAAMSNRDSLLSRKRLRLISRMFYQMCDAVQACHDVGIAHRDIKPENFIVVDGQGDKRRWDAPEQVKEKGRVVVKITDWGLGTMEEMCEDFDCGSKPYMAYECRNNLRPTYDPRQADVWSLGLVLLNLLYHRNPWADPSLSDPDFAEYVEAPLEFLKERFEGIGDEVATFLADRVFCDVLEVVDGRERRRVSAGEFGRWAMKLVVMMGEGAGGFGLNPINGNLNYRPSPLGASASTANGDDGFSGLDFSPVPSMPITIGNPSSPSPVPPSASLLSQFAPSTIKASTLLGDLPTDLPKVPEESEPSSFATARPAYITSPTQLSEDDSLPSPTFSSPNPIDQSLAPATTSPDSLYSPLPSAAASPTRSLFPQRPHYSPAVSDARVPSANAPAPSAPLPWSASSPFAIPQASLSTPFAPILAPSSTSISAKSTVTPLSATQSPGLLSPPISMLTATRTNVDAVEAKVASIDLNDSTADETDNTVLSPETPSPDEQVKSGCEGDATDAAKDGEDKDKDGEKARSKRRKRGARKEKRAAKQAAQGKEDVLEELAAASQDLARELSAASSPQSTFSTGSKTSSRPRPSIGSRSHGTQSTSAVPTSLSTGSASTTAPAGKKSGGMFGRLKTLVNEGNPDLEAFKRRVDERNASIGAKADTYSAPAKMQGARRPGMGTPLSSRGSVGTASFGSTWSGVDGGDEAPRGRGGADKDDHWRSASSRRDRLNDRRQRSNVVSPPTDFPSSVGSSSTRGTTTTNPLTNFDSSRNNTPLSSFSSVGSESVSYSLGPNAMTSSAMTSTSTVRGESETWRNTPASPPRRPYSSTRPSRAPLPASAATARPILKDAAIDTSDLGSPLPSPPLSVPTPPPIASPASLAPPRVVPSTSSPSPVSPSITSPPTPGKTNKLAKMLNSISVFNRQQASPQ
ncbi:hypothetical protein JCM10212_002478 [Sporobolomyces blumeae]